MADWTLSLGKPQAVGRVGLGVTLSLLGYVAVQLGWRAYVRVAWRARREQRARK
jgi:uncharacterized protein (DUF2062 family)